MQWHLSILHTDIMQYCKKNRDYKILESCSILDFIKELGGHNNVGI